MLGDISLATSIYIVTGYTDLRSGIDTLVSIVDAKTDNSPYVPDTLYLFCGQHFTDTTNAYRAYSSNYLKDERVQPLRDIFMTYELLERKQRVAENLDKKSVWSV